MHWNRHRLAVIHSLETDQNWKIEYSAKCCTWKLVIYIYIYINMFIRIMISMKNESRLAFFFRKYGHGSVPYPPLWYQTQCSNCYVFNEHAKYRQKEQSLVGHFHVIGSAMILRNRCYPDELRWKHVQLHRHHNNSHVLRHEMTSIGNPIEEIRRSYAHLTPRNGIFYHA